MRAWLCIAALLFAVLLAGCEEGREAPLLTGPSPSPLTPTASTTRSPDASRPEPTLPAAAMHVTSAGAEAFIRYFWALVNYAQKTGDVATLRSVVVDTCPVCISAIDFVDEVYQQGGRITGGRYSVEDESASREGGAWTVRAQVHVGVQHVVDAGDLDETFTPGTRLHVLTLTHHKSGWQVTDWVIP